MARVIIRRIVCGRRYSRGILCERSDDGVFEWRYYTSSVCASKNLKVTIVSAGGDTARSLAVCLKQSPLIDELAIHDNYPAYGLLQDLSHMDTSCRTFVPEQRLASAEGLEHALKGAKIVLVTLDHRTMYEEAKKLEKIVPVLGGCCPKAFVALVSRWVNSLLPMMLELYKKVNVYNSNRIFGVLNLFTVRANGFAAQTLEIDPEFVEVPIVGGGCPKTCVPLFSHTRPCAKFTNEELSRLMNSMKMANDQVAEAYGYADCGSYSSSLCSGFGAARFCVSLCKAIKDESHVQECAYIRSCQIPGLKYFGSPLLLGPTGIQKQLGVPKLTNQECAALYEALPEIKKAIALGERFVLGNCRNSSEVCPVPPCCTVLQTC